MRASCRAEAARGRPNVGLSSAPGAQGHFALAREHRDLTRESDAGAVAQAPEHVALGGAGGGEPLGAAHHLDATEAAVGGAAAEGDGRRDLVAEVEQAHPGLRRELERRAPAALDTHRHHGASMAPSEPRELRYRTRMDAPEVVIVGGGPAGSTLAGRLAQRGRRAVVLEKERFPRFHVGESLLPRSMEVLRALGVEDELEARFQRKYAARFLCSRTGREAIYRFDEAFDPAYAYAYQVPRAEFDHLLLRRAAELGATVREGVAVSELLLEGERVIGVRAQGEGGESEELRAPVVVDATGRDTAFATRMRAKSALPGLDKTAFFAHFRGAERLPAPSEGDLRLVLFEHGWMWLIPLRGELTSVGVVVSSEWVKARARDESVDDYFHRTLALSGWTRAILANAERVGPVRTAADFSYRTRALAGDGWLAVGDAGGFLDPIFSTGAHLAIKGADLAAAAIDEALARGDTSRSAFAGYERSQREATDLFFGLVRDFYAGELAETLFAEAQRPTLRKLITTLLAGDVFHPGAKPPWVAWVRGRYPATVLGA